MNYSIAVVIMMVGLSIVSADIKPNSFIEECLKQKLFLTIYEEFDDEKRGGHLRDSQHWAKRLNDELEKIYGLEEMGIADKFYFDGIQAYIHKDKLNATNAWKKYLDAVECHKHKPNQRQIDEVRRFYHSWNIERNKLWGDSSSIPQITTVTQPTDLNYHVKKRSVPKKRSSNPKPKEELAHLSDNRNLIIQAERAELSGRYEQAVHLYRLAQQIDPDSQELEEKIESLEEMFQ